MISQQQQRRPPTARRDGVFYLLCAISVAGFAVAPYLVFVVAPIEATLGIIQKIFYFHVPSAWAMFLAAVLAAVGGGALLFKGRAWGDALLAAGAELTLVFGTIVLVTGPLWARRSWGHYWVWDVRLTTVLVLFLVFCGVLLARRYGGAARQRVAAGLALFGAADVPLIYISVQLWRTMHPKTTVVGGLPPEMQRVFFFSLALFTVLFVVLLWVRFRLERTRQLLDELYVAAAERER